ncbi:VOC family protein [Dactylosporangium sp. NPDC051541]|uniref:VOC family protein n=1 Tax=Dactylosporangium sp. NPDC051541 TaxID=3363977 RepID=UPI0037B06E9A
MRLKATVLNASDAGRLARFYSALLEWPIDKQEDGWVTLRDPAGGAALSLQTEELYRPPVWPAAEHTQQMMMHLDIACDDLTAAVARAVELGATVAEWQPQDDVRVCLDPDGHPFCLYVP